MLRRSFLKAVAGLFVLPALSPAESFSGTISGEITITIGLSDERIRQLVDDGWQVEVDARTYERSGITVRFVSPPGEVGAEYTNSIYCLQSKTKGHLNLVTLGPSADFFPYNLSVDVG